MDPGWPVGLRDDDRADGGLSRYLLEEINPLGILRLDHFEFPFPAPTLDALLVGDGILDVIIMAMPYQTLDAIAPRESINVALSMLQNPPIQVRRDAGV
jgi:hypothetical protein